MAYKAQKAIACILTAVFTSVAFAQAQKAPHAANTNSIILPDNCAMAFAVDEHEKYTPRFDEYLKAMDKLPLTGKSIAATIRREDVNALICEDSKAKTAFEVNRELNAFVIRPDTDFLELASFHSRVNRKQNMNQASFNDLTHEDAILAILITEAYTTAYELALLQEASNANLIVRKSTSVVIVPDQTEETKKTDWTKDAEIVKVFKTRYEAEPKGTPEEIEKAIIKAGQDVIRYLISGENKEWIEEKGGMAVKFVLSNKGAFVMYRNPAPVYTIPRKTFFSKIGYLKKDISLTPAEYITKDNSVFDKALNQLKIDLKKPAMPRNYKHPKIPLPETGKKRALQMPLDPKKLTAGIF